MLGQASSRLRSARMAMREKNYAYAIRSSQECVELSLKASLRLMGVEYPKKHDVSRILLAYGHRFPKWFPIERFARESRVLAEKRELAMYGDELRSIPASTLFDREGAREAFESARGVFDACSRLLREVGRVGRRTHRPRKDSRRSGGRRPPNSRSSDPEGGFGGRRPQ
jgi:HEPN domain-containing protein